MLFFEYYTKYNSSPTEHQVFTSPPTERSIYFVHHHVLPLSVFIFQEHSSVKRAHASGLAKTTPCSGTSGQTTPCSGTALITLRPQLGDFVARSSTCARGLPRPLSDHSLGISHLNYMRLTIRIQLGYFFSFRPCYKAHTSPYSKLGDYIHGLLFLVAGANLIIFVQWISTRLHASGAAIKS